jgi:hypothetical protein
MTRVKTSVGSKEIPTFGHNGIGGTCVPKSAHVAQMKRFSRSSGVWPHPWGQDQFLIGHLARVGFDIKLTEDAGRRLSTLEFVN